MRSINLWTCGILILLTFTSYLLSNQVMRTAFVYILTLLTMLKVLLVAFQYMELKKAHRAWLSIILVVLVVYGGVIISLYQ